MLRAARVRGCRKTTDHVGNFRDVLPSQGTNRSNEQSVNSTLNLTGEMLRAARVRGRRKTTDHVGNFRDVLPSQSTNRSNEQSVNSTLNLTGEMPRTARAHKRRKTMDHMGNFRDVLPSQGTNRSNEQSVNSMGEQQVWWHVLFTLHTSVLHLLLLSPHRTMWSLFPAWGLLWWCQLRLRDHLG